MDASPFLPIANPSRTSFFYVQNPIRGLPVLNSRGEIVDDWGRPLVIKGDGLSAPFIYSVGPNGRDDGGGADDILGDSKDLGEPAPQKNSTNVETNP
jgi:hypothetical protein